MYSAHIRECHFFYNESRFESSERRQQERREERRNIAALQTKVKVGKLLLCYGFNNMLNVADFFLLLIVYSSFRFVTIF